VHSLPMIYQTAGAELTFDEKAIGDLVDLVEREIGRIRAQLPRPAGTQSPNKARAANRT
jgi:hypothetical protein